MSHHHMLKEVMSNYLTELAEKKLISKLKMHNLKRRRLEIIKYNKGAKSSKIYNTRPSIEFDHDFS